MRFGPVELSEWPSMKRFWRRLSELTQEGAPAGEGPNSSDFGNTDARGPSPSFFNKVACRRGLRLRWGHIAWDHKQLRSKFQYISNQASRGWVPLEQIAQFGPSLAPDVLKSTHFQLNPAFLTYSLHLVTIFAQSDSFH